MIESRGFPTDATQRQGSTVSGTGSLCAPVSGVTCFHCCPPIRPTNHDTYALRESWSELLRRNSREIRLNLSAPKAIDGRSCWGLGFLDSEERQVGCLLHPERNRGQDLRNLVYFGEKCARESCQEAKVFERLEPEERRLCLACASMENSFMYSSRSYNPLFRLLAWEETVIRAVLRRESGHPVTREHLIEEYAFLFSVLSPRVDGYWVGRLLEVGNWDVLDGDGVELYLSFRDSLSMELRELWGIRAPRSSATLPMVHAHSIPLSLSRWLKFGVGIWRCSREEITAMQEFMERKFLEFLGARCSPTVAESEIP